MSASIDSMLCIVQSSTCVNGSVDSLILKQKEFRIY